MNRNEYKAVTERIIRAHQLPIAQREEHRETLDALIRQAARYEFEHHILALYRIQDGTARIVLRHLADHLARLIQAVTPEDYAREQEQVILAAQQMLLAGAAMGGVTDVIEQLNLFDLVQEDPDCPFETGTAGKEKAHGTGRT